MASMGKRSMNLLQPQNENYRAIQDKDGQEYQDFVVDECLKFGLFISLYGSQKYQYTKGESANGIEVKLDKIFASSGNLWIEVAEKARQRNGDYVPSGIMRDDNTWLYVIGDYKTIFIFAKTLLRLLMNAKNPDGTDRYPIQPNNYGTSQGFLLNRQDAEKFAACIIRPE